MTTYTIERDGRRLHVETDLTIPQALDILRSQRASGVRDARRDALIEKRLLSLADVADLMAMAMSARSDAQPSSAIDALGVLKMLRRAAEAQKKRPRITLRLPNCSQIEIFLSRDGGAAYVSTRGEACAVINASGELKARNESIMGLFETVRGPLRALAANPAAVAGQHGVATGKCCFCRRALSDRRSREVGYGPECAGRYGLPWGSTAGVDAANEAALEAGGGILEGRE